MNRFPSALAAVVLGLWGFNAYAQSYSTGAVNIYNTCGLSPDLPNRIEAAKRFRDWYNQAGFPLAVPHPHHLARVRPGSPGSPPGGPPT